MEIPGLGPVVEDPEFGWYLSAPLRVSVLGTAVCRFLVDGYDADPAKDEFHSAIAAFLALDLSALGAATPSVFEYYRDAMTDCDDDVDIAGPTDVWDHVHVGDEVLVQRRAYADKRVYVSVEYQCEWESEHGLQIVFRDGRTVAKVGPHDGHLTNADAYARDDLEDVVYYRP